MCFGHDTNNPEPANWSAASWPWMLVWLGIQVMVALQPRDWMYLGTCFSLAVKLQCFTDWRQNCPVATGYRSAALALSSCKVMGWSESSGESVAVAIMGEQCDYSVSSWLVAQRGWKRQDLLLKCSAYLLASSTGLGCVGSVWCPVARLRKVQVHFLYEWEEHHSFSFCL